jgi:hypothetical protein
MLARTANDPLNDFTLAGKASAFQADHAGSIPATRLSGSK